MTYTIISAQFANSEHTSAVVMTEESASVALSEVDTPEEWVAMLEWGEPEAFVEQVGSAPQSATEKLTAFLIANPDVMALLDV